MYHITICTYSGMQMEEMVVEWDDYFLFFFFVQVTKAGILNLIFQTAYQVVIEPRPNQTITTARSQNKSKS